MSKTEVETVEEQLKFETCGICQGNKEDGIHIYHFFICQSCERKMIETQPEDEQYSYFVDKLKQMNKKKQYS
ncbi:sigma factor G inhibitor Gin [Paraliobacillus salinarum]|uniref:sigma factor G inhibitor Gin n=1 Tax=Paraliobacillus salinarum TaxID=1158996 RepID=UPI0015F61C48|nr:sigma factor G inhibitor Gin [Paraliobacillus salinarum]